MKDSKIKIIIVIIIITSLLGFSDLTYGIVSNILFTFILGHPLFLAVAFINLVRIIGSIVGLIILAKLMIKSIFYNLEVSLIKLASIMFLFLIVSMKISPKFEGINSAIIETAINLIGNVAIVIKLIHILIMLGLLIVAITIALNIIVSGHERKIDILKLIQNRKMQITTLISSVVMTIGFIIDEFYYSYFLNHSNNLSGAFTHETPIGLVILRTIILSIGYIILVINYLSVIKDGKNCILLNSIRGKIVQNKLLVENDKR